MEQASLTRCRIDRSAKLSVGVLRRPFIPCVALRATSARFLSTHDLAARTLVVVVVAPAVGRVRQVVRERVHMREGDHGRRRLRETGKLAFRAADRAAALAKLRAAACGYDPLKDPALKAFEGKALRPAELRELLFRAFRLRLPPPELAAAFAELDADGNGWLECVAHAPAVATARGNRFDRPASTSQRPARVNHRA